MFNRDVEKCEEVEAWMSGMKTYFHIYNYSGRLTTWTTIYNLNLTKKDYIWWKDIKRVKNLMDKYLTRRVFKSILK